MSEEVIDIERFDNTVIEVRSPSVTLEETVVEEATIEKRPPLSIFSLPRRIIIGISLLILLIVPVVFGIFMSSVLQGHLLKSVNPGNVWPDSGLGVVRKIGVIPKSDDYSLIENNFHLIQEEDSLSSGLFEFEDPKTKKKYFLAMYLIENLLGKDGLYGFCGIIQAEKSDNLTPNPIFSSFVTKSGATDKDEDIYFSRYFKITERSLGLDNANYYSSNLSNLISGNLNKTDTFDDLRNSIVQSLKILPHSRLEFYLLPKTVNSKMTGLEFVEKLNNQRNDAKTEAENKAAEEIRQNQESAKFSQNFSTSRIWE